MTLAGFPHSDISGSTLLCSSPERFAAYASFFGSLSLGIRRTPLVAYFVKQLLSSLLDALIYQHNMQFSKSSHARQQFRRRRVEMIPEPKPKVNALEAFVKILATLALSSTSNRSYLELRLFHISSPLEVSAPNVKRNPGLRR